MSATLQVTVDEEDDERFLFVFKEQFRLFRSLQSGGGKRSAKTAEKFENLMNQAHAIVLSGKLKKGQEQKIS